MGENKSRFWEDHSLFEK